MRTIEDLRKLAELNLCKDCFQKYRALIEPTIEYWLFVPLADWKQVESEVTQMVMKTKGIFKGEKFFYNLTEGNDKKYADDVDGKAFRKTKKLPFKRKIDYLHANGILQDSSYQLLDIASKKRNQIHDASGFSEQNYTLFHVASIITNLIWSAMMVERKDDMFNMSTNLKSNAEKIAEQWLKKSKEKA
jgi:hypothetical protein